MQSVVQVRLREAGQTLYFILDKINLKVDDYVLIEADRGIDYGQVITECEVLSEEKLEEGIKKVLRLASLSDIKQIEQNKYRKK